MHPTTIKKECQINADILYFRSEILLIADTVNLLSSPTKYRIFKISQYPKPVFKLNFDIR
jgi:hypothetical protein